MNSIIMDWLKLAFFDLFNSVDRDLIDRGVHENCINHRLAVWLEKHRPEKFSDYYVDVEFNKNGDEEKIVYDEKNKKRYIRPDIIVHKRTKDASDNLIAIECKKYLDSDWDISKLAQLKSGKYEYSHCIAVKYMPRADSFFIKFAQDGFGEKEIKKDLSNWDSALEKL